METTTRATLLERLRDGADALAWRDFFERYGPAMYGFARRHGCSDETAQDVVQEAMVAVFENRQVFRYDPSRGRYRNWLCTVVRQKIAALRRRQAHEARGRGAEGSEGPPESFPIAEGDAPDAAWEAVFEKSLLLALLEVVRQEVTPETYQAFELTALHGVSGADAAALTGLSRNAVYLARQRVLRRLCELGAPYREGGQLDERVREALEVRPSPAVQRSLTSRLETTLGVRQELGR